MSATLAQTGTRRAELSKLCDEAVELLSQLELARTNRERQRAVEPLKRIRYQAFELLCQDGKPFDEMQRFYPATSAKPR